MLFPRSSMLLILQLLTLLLARTALAAWGYTTSGSSYVVDTGKGLVVTVSSTNGDITSMKYNGAEYNGYGGKYTQVESGLGASTVSIQQYSDPYVIKITVVYGTLKHYLFFRYGNNNVYIFTNKADDSVQVQRYIVRFPSDIFPHSTADSDYEDASTVVIESQDVNEDQSTGYTFSKHYSGYQYGRTIDYDYVGKSNGNVGMWIIRSNHEKASAGPFFRSLLRRGSDDGEDLYEIYYYSMGNTDVQRFGLQGPTVLAFTDGGTPSSSLFARNADWGWFDNMGIDGWVPASGRGYAAGVGLANTKSGYTYVVALANDAAQYWGTADASNNYAWKITGVLPGTYTLTVYKRELEVSTRSVTVSAGAGVAVNTITCDDPEDDSAIWRIGSWDGTPAGFLNFGDSPMKPTYMHPSDSRLSNWDPSNYIVGTSSASNFPGYMWVDINNNHIVYFRLTADQLASSHTIRIGLTEAFINGRPKITVNSWDSGTTASTGQASTRSLTVGTYRGNNVMLTWNVPSSAFTQDTSAWQVLTITVISGSTGSGYLSAGISIDAVDMLS